MRRYPAVSVWVRWSLLVGMVLAACGEEKTPRVRDDDEDQPRRPRSAASASGSASASALPSASSSSSASAAVDVSEPDDDGEPARPSATKLDPLLTLAYRAEACLEGTRALALSLDDYKKSVGPKGLSPGAKPSFGVAAPAASDRPRPLPFERLTRACTVAAAIKNVGAEADPLLAELKSTSELALPLAKKISELNSYLQKGEDKVDGFAKGKTLDQELALADLRRPQERLGASLDVWRSARAPDSSSWSAPQKQAASLVSEARKAQRALFRDVPDVPLAQSSLKKVESELATLLSLRDKSERDPFLVLMQAPVERYVSGAKLALATPSAENKIEAIQQYVRMIEAQHRAAQRLLVRERSVRPTPPRMP